MSSTWLITLVDEPGTALPVNWHYTASSAAAPAPTTRAPHRADFSYSCLDGGRPGRACCFLLARPCLGEKRPQGHCASLYQPCHDKQKAVSKTPDLASCCGLRSGPALGDVSGRLRHQTARRLDRIGLPADTRHPQRRSPKRQLHSVYPLRVGHFRLLPVPTSLRNILEATPESRFSHDTRPPLPAPTPGDFGALASRCFGS